MVDWKDLIGKRVLVQQWWSSLFEEVIVKEVSPSTRRVCFLWNNDICRWEQSDTYKVIEVLTNK